MRFFVKCFVYCSFLLIKDIGALTNVTLTIQPPIVEKNSSALLICSYDLQKSELYSAKWFRGKYEFYRYTPSDPIKTQIFAIPGGIKANLASSNSTQVKLLEVDFHISGNFTCEVTTTEMPQVGTKTSPNASLEVVQLPQRSPQISIHDEHLTPGATLKANCTSYPSRPPTRLKFLINNYTEAYTIPSLSNSEKYDWSDLALVLVLEKKHFLDGRLIVTCVAQIGQIYKAEAVLEVGHIRNAISERVQADEAPASSTSTQLTIISLTVLTIMLFL